MNFCNTLKIRNILISEPVCFSVTTCTEGMKSLCQLCLIRTKWSLKTHHVKYFFLQPGWGDKFSDNSSCSLSNPIILASTQGQTQVSNPPCNNLSIQRWIAPASPGLSGTMARIQKGSPGVCTMTRCQCLDNWVLPQASFLACLRYFYLLF